jgi:DNA (cytosine-5)-methyltransferase 1
MLTVGSLFAGIGGFDLGLERAGMTIKWQIEKDDFCNKVLKKHWPNVKKYRDIKEVSIDELEPVDVVCGGFPCQPFSQAGKRRGTKDDRYLWPEMLRIIRGIRPDWVIGENVAGIVNMELDKILSDLENEKYTCQTFIIPACAVNAPHRRDRVWVVAHTINSSNKNDQRTLSKEKSISQINREKLGARESAGTIRQSIADSNRKRLQGCRQHGECSGKWITGAETWEIPWIQVATRFCRVDDGVPRGLDRTQRLKALGNAVVPQIVEVIGKVINQTKDLC